MTYDKRKQSLQILLRLSVVLVLLAAAPSFPDQVEHAADSGPAPVPLLAKGHPVDWWVVFKFNSAAFPGCGGGATRACLFGGDAQNYKLFGQQFVYASSESRSFQVGSDCLSVKIRTGTPGRIGST